MQSADGRALMHVLSGLTRLRRLCCSPELVMPEWSQTSSKLDEHQQARKLLNITKLLYPTLGGPELQTKFEAIERQLNAAMKAEQPPVSK